VSRLPEIHKMLILSTSHLPEDVLDNLDIAPGVIAYQNEYGAFVWVSSVEDLTLSISAFTVGIPAELAIVFDYARKLDCKYIKFDRDGPVMSELSTWDW